MRTLNNNLKNIIIELEERVAEEERREAEKEEEDEPERNSPLKIIRRFISTE